MIAVGLTLQPDEEYLALLDPLLRGAVDYFEVAPETTWWADEQPPHLRLRPNGFHRKFAELGAQTGKWFVAHGVGLSLGTGSKSDAPRRRAWLRRLRADQAVFRYRWFTDHLGATSVAGLNLALPVPLWLSAARGQVVKRRLRSMQRVVPLVGIENTASYFTVGDPLEEPAFLSAVLGATGGHLLLDLHNVLTMAENFGFDPLADYINRLALSQVIEIHLAGGSYSDGAWLPGGRSLRLDSHDHAVPEAVWDLLAAVLPRCPNLRGVTLERMEATVTAGDVPLIEAELARLRRLLAERP